MKGDKFIIYSYFTILAWFGLAISSAAAAAGDVVERPVSDWLKNNPHGGRWLAGKYVVCMGANPLMDFSALPDGVGVFPDAAGEEAGQWDSILALPEGKAVTTGRILEKTMPDGSAELTIEINVKNGPLTIYRWDEFVEYINARRADPENEDLLDNPPEPVLGDQGDGSMDYSQLVKITNPSPGMEIAGIYQYIFGQIPGGDVRVWTFNGTGTGTFTEHAADFVDWHFTPGETGTVHLPGTFSNGKPGKSQGEAFEMVIE